MSDKLCTCRCGGGVVGTWKVLALHACMQYLAFGPSGICAYQELHCIGVWESMSWIVSSSTEWNDACCDLFQSLK